MKLDRNEFDRDDHSNVLTKIWTEKDKSGLSSNKVYIAFEEIEKIKFLKDLSNSDEKSIKLFLEKLTKQTQLILIDLDSDVKAHEVFMNLNTKGLNLNEIDKIRSYIYGVLKDDFDKQNWGYFYDNLVNKYDSFTEDYILIFIAKNFPDEYKQELSKKSKKSIAYYILSNCKSKDKIRSFNNAILKQKNIDFFVSVLKSEINVTMFNGTYTQEITIINNLLKIIYDMNYKQYNFLIFMMLFEFGIEDNKSILINNYISKNLKKILSYMIVFSVSKAVPNIYKNDLMDIKTLHNRKMKQWCDEKIKVLNLLEKNHEGLFKENLKSDKFKVKKGIPYKIMKAILILTFEDVSFYNNTTIEHIICVDEYKKISDKKISDNEKNRFLLGNLLLLKKDNFKNMNFSKKYENYVKLLDKTGSLNDFLSNYKDSIAFSGKNNSELLNSIDSRTDYIIKEFLKRRIDNCE